MTTQRHPGADLSHDGAERVQGEGREGFVASTGVPETRIAWSDEERGKLMYAAGHLASAEDHPEDAHAADSLDLGWEVLDGVVAARLAEAEAKVARVEALLKEVDDIGGVLHVVGTDTVRRALDGTR